MKDIYVYEIKVYNIENDELTTEFITSEIPPDLAQEVGFKRTGKEIYPARVWALGHQITDLSMPVINYEN